MAAVALAEAVIICLLIVTLWLHHRSARRREDHLLDRVVAPEVEAIERLEEMRHADLELKRKLDRDNPPTVRRPQRERSMADRAGEVQQIDQQLAERGLTIDP